MKVGQTPLLLDWDTANWHTWQKEGGQVAKKRVGKFTKTFPQMAVDRRTQCDNIVELAKGLGISRQLL
jgi:hypothetical protein